MNNIKQIFSYSKILYINWLFNPRIMLFILVFIYLLDTAILPMLNTSIELGYSLNILEPFLLITTKGYFASFLPLLFAMLMSDFPNNEQSTIFFNIRISRRKWLISQWIFSLMVTITILLFFLLVTIVMTFKNGYCANIWSYYTTLTSKNYPEIFNNSNNIFLEKNLYLQAYPFEAFLRIILLFFLYMQLICSILIFFKLINKRMLGVIFVFIEIIGGMITWGLVSDIMWFFPMANAVFSWHYIDFLSQENIPIWYSYLYFIIPILILNILNFIIVKKHNFIDDI